MQRLSVIVLLLLVAVPAGAQSGQEASSALRAAPLELPDGDSAWAVRIIRTGGPKNTFLDIAVMSTGQVLCAQPPTICNRTLESADLQPIASLIVDKDLSKAKSALTASCHDCFVTRITIRRREPGKKTQTYFGYWDDGSAAKAPFEFVRLATEIVALAK